MRWHTLTHPALLLAAAAAAVNLAAPPTAAACSPESCYQGSFFLGPDATIPANTPALRWALPRNFIPGEQQLDHTLHITRIDGGEQDEVAFELELGAGDAVLWLSEELVPGGRYELWVESEDECVTPPIELTAGEADALPERLGAVEMSRARRKDVAVATSSGSCDTLLPAVAADVDIALAAEAKPWAALFEYTTHVDGETWEPQWTLGSDLPYDFQGAQTLLFAECPGARADGREIDDSASHFGLEPGEHRVRIEARLPGVERVLATDAAPLELDCATPDFDIGKGRNPTRTFVDTQPGEDAGASSCKVARPGTRGRGTPASSVLGVVVAALLMRSRKGRRA
jgi:hypothetical protein